MAEVMLNGLKDGGTFYVDSTTKAAIGTDFDSAVNKVVTVVNSANGTVGYGKSGDFIQGVIQKVEKLDNSSDELVATVLWARTFEDIACATSDKPGAVLVCDGSGGVKTATAGDSPVLYTTVALSVDSSSKKAAIHVR